MDVGASWSRTSPTVYRALSAGFTAGSTIISRGRLFQRGNLSFDHVNKPTRAPFFGGVARRLSSLPGGKLSIVKKPRIVGAQKAAWLLYTGERIDGREALAIGLVDKLVPMAEVRSAAHAMAAEIAASGPLAVQATRATLRRALLISRGDPMVFLQEPISLAFLLVAAALLIVIAAPAIRKRREEALQE